MRLKTCDSLGEVKAVQFKDSTKRLNNEFKSQSGLFRISQIQMVLTANKRFGKKKY